MKIKGNVFKLPAVIFLLCMPFLPQLNADDTLFEQELLLEKSFQEKTERLVEKITGSRDLVVLVDVELEREKPAPQKKPSYPGMALEQEEYLPGINYPYVPNETAGQTPGNILIKKVHLLITLDANMPDAVVSRIKKETTSLLRMNAGRGDGVDVERIAFAPPKSSWKEVLSGFGPLIFWTLGLLLLTLFLFGPVRHFFRTVVKAMEIKIKADAHITGYEGALNSPSSIIPSLLPGRRDTEDASSRIGGYDYHGKIENIPMRLKKFGYIDSENIKNLVFLIKNEPPEKIAIVTNYLPPVFASQIVGSLQPGIQSKVALALTTPRIIDPQEVDEIEKEFKIKLDYMVGGEEYFLNLLDGVDKESQGNILKSLDSSNPALAAKLRKSLFFFEDIINMEKSVLQKVIRESQKKGISLALTLKYSDDELKLTVLNVLSEGARAMLAEQIDLLGSVSEKRVFEEQKAFENLVRNLEKNGEIAIGELQKTNIIDINSGA